MSAEQLKPGNYLGVVRKPRELPPLPSSLPPARRVGDESEEYEDDYESDTGRSEANEYEDDDFVYMDDTEDGSITREGALHQLQLFASAATELMSVIKLHDDPAPQQKRQQVGEKQEQPDAKGEAPKGSVFLLRRQLRRQQRHILMQKKDITRLAEHNQRLLKLLEQSVIEEDMDADIQQMMSSSTTADPWEEIVRPSVGAEATGDTAAVDQNNANCVIC
jgi:hypothetical protein